MNILKELRFRLGSARWARELHKSVENNRAEIRHLQNELSQGQGQLKWFREELTNKNREIKRLEESTESLSERLIGEEKQTERVSEQLRKREFRIARLENRLAGDAPAVWSGTNNRSRGDSTLLVTFCNVKDENKPVLAAVNLCADEPRIRWIGLKEDSFLIGATGMCFWNDLLCVAHQGGPKIPQGFVLLDPSQNFERVYEGVLPHSAGVHSVCSRDGELYFVASGKDSVYRVSLEEQTGEWACSLYWTFSGSSGQQDENHLNAIEHIEKDLYVSGFGKKKSDQWPSATEGFIYNVDREEYVVDSVYHPHSLLKDSGSLWTCESAKGKILSSAGDGKNFPPGYARGLAISEGHFYVGTSKRRKVSESTGTVNPQVSEEYEGNCCVYMLPKGSSDQPEMLVDFSDIRNEIYEMVLI